MRLKASALLGLLFAGAITASPQPALPLAVSNNAVAGGTVNATWWAFSLLGIDSTKRWSGITRSAFAWSPGMSAWRRLPDVPGPVGRLAATAQVVRGRLYLFGGYTVDSSGAERSLDVVDVLDLAANRWTTAAPMPVAVDDAVSVTWRDSLVYLVSGWHDTDNVRDVQVFDVVRNRWSPATPIPGPGVFGHTGSLAGNTIVFVDGALKQSSGAKYALHQGSYAGTIDPRDPRRIVWRDLPRHPGPARYRAASAGCNGLVLFAGGTDNPYNFNGIGYNQAPSGPLATAFAWDTRLEGWRELAAAPVATMDHRGMLIRGDTATVIGGMIAAQRVSPAVTRWTIGGCVR